MLNSLRQTGETYIGNEVPVKLMRKGSLETGYFNFVYKPVQGSSGSYDNIIVVATEVTENISARMKIVESESRLRFMAESMPRKIFTAKPNGDVDYYNPQWFEYTGLKYEDIKEWGWTQFIHPSDLKENIKRWQHSIYSGEQFEFEHRFKRADGTYRWHISRAHPQLDKNGKIVKWVGSNTDIEELKKSQEVKDRLTLLTKQRNELVKINSIKDEFISIASHQLRTPASVAK